MKKRVLHEMEIKHYFPTIHELKKKIEPYLEEFHKKNDCWCGVHFAYWMKNFTDNDDFLISHNATGLLSELIGIGWNVTSIAEIDSNSDIIVTFKGRE